MCIKHSNQLFISKYFGFWWTYFGEIEVSFQTDRVSFQIRNSMQIITSQMPENVDKKVRQLINANPSSNNL